MKRYLIEPGRKVKLSEWDPNDTSEFIGNKEQAQIEIEKLNHRLEQLQEVLYAEHTHKILIVLQAMDTGGKDGAIRHVFEGVNPNGTRVANFTCITWCLPIPGSSASTRSMPSNKCSRKMGPRS